MRMTWETLISVFVGLVAGWIASGRWRRPTNLSTAPVTTDSEGPPAGEGPPALSTRLHALDQQIQAFADHAAHVREFAEQPCFKEAVAVLADDAVPLASVMDYATGERWTLVCVALAALAVRADKASAIPQLLRNSGNLSAWQAHFAFALFAGHEPHPAMGAPLAHARDWWVENPHMLREVRGYFELVADDPVVLGDELEAASAEQRAIVARLLGEVQHPTASALAALIETTPTSGPSQSAVLAGIGRYWQIDPATSLLIEPAGWGAALAAAARNLDASPPRPLLVSGDALTGKTTFLRLLAERAAGSGWQVVEAGAADLLAGQQYFGQLEGRIQEMIEALDRRNKVIWYVPDPLGLARSGTHQGQSSSILDQVMPAIASGRIIMWTEATPSGTAQLMQARPATRRLFEIVRLEPMEPEDAVAITQGVIELIARRASVTAAPGLAAMAVEAAEHYLSSASLPGSAVSLVKLAAQSLEAADHARRLEPHDLLVTLAQQTGLPLAILDGSERLQLDELRQHFASRVIGQPDAVDSIVERIAMLKSGLNDPGKPIGVFLFAGPTGTGKTEFAKAIAEYLFGSIDRMIRLDMSEYQTPDTVAKILGGGSLPPDAETLIARVRKQPFSLILLDEFEKSDPHIWDLFLQVFDEGRLSDATGDVADFRHSLIILTTNLGATAHRDSGLGFAPSRGGFTNDQILRVVSQTFRPEFQNRLDKVIVFQPLTRELMRGILKKELDLIFERRGLKDRAWAVEWESSALEFLLEKGFSPDMGARPLKRAIDQYVIAPLAATIVERRFPQGDQFVFVRRDGDRLSAVFVDPDTDDEHEAGQIVEAGATSHGPPSIPRIILAPTGDSDESAALEAGCEGVAGRIGGAEWSEAKEALARVMGEADFWSRADRFEALSRLELMDRLEVATETAQSLAARLSKRRSGSAGPGARDLAARLALQVHLIEEGLQDLDTQAPSDVAIAVEIVAPGAASPASGIETWRQQIAAMYLAWARKRNMHIAEIEDVAGVPSPVRIFAGFGAHRVLAREVGMHVLESVETNGGGRLAVRVMIAPVPAGSLARTEQRRLLSDAFRKAERSNVVLRRYRREPSPLVRNADGSWRSGKVDEVLAGDFDLLEASRL